MHGIKGKKRMCALTMWCKSQLSCMVWMWGPHRDQSQDFFSTSRALDGQLYLHFREPWNTDTHVRDIRRRYSHCVLMGNTKWLLCYHNLCLNTSQAAHKSFKYNLEKVWQMFIQFCLTSSKMHFHFIIQKFHREFPFQGHPSKADSAERFTQWNLKLC